MISRQELNSELLKKMPYGPSKSTKKLLFIPTQYAGLLRTLSERNLIDPSLRFNGTYKNFNKLSYKKYTKCFNMEKIQNSPKLKLPFPSVRNLRNNQKAVFTACEQRSSHDVI